MKSKLKSVARTGIFLASIISFAFAYILWNGVLDLEQVFAIMFFIAGLTKLIWGLSAK